MIPIEQWEGMRVLTVRNPWALLIVDGLKDVENRTRAMGYRGPLLIHAGKALTPEYYEAAHAWVKAHAEWALPEFPSWSACREACGKIIGGVSVSGCSAACGKSSWRMEEAAYGIELKDAWRADTYVRAVGALGLWRYSAAKSANGRAARQEAVEALA